MGISDWWSDLFEFWWDLFDNPLHSIYAVGFCFVVVLIATVLILWWRPAEVRKLAWRVFLASAGFCAAIFGLWFKPALTSYSWIDLLITSGFGVGLVLVVCIANYWCVAILLVWRYNNEHRHSWHVWTAWLFTTGWISWSLFNLGL
ncbi:MAG TPA: hypothetical protein VIR04_07815 [Paralcaligenes sp.]|jgi:hypothetical protein